MREKEGQRGRGTLGGLGRARELLRAHRRMARDTPFRIPPRADTIRLFAPPRLHLTLPVETVGQQHDVNVAEENPYILFVR